MSGTAASLFVVVVLDAEGESAPRGAARRSAKSKLIVHDNGLANFEIADALSARLDSVELRGEDEAAVEQALFTWRDSGADFADCLIGARNRRLGCAATATFDGRAAKVPGFIAA